MQCSGGRALTRAVTSSRALGFNGQPLFQVYSAAAILDLHTHAFRSSCICLNGYFCFSKCTHLQGSIQRLLLPPCNWSALYFRKRQNISAAGKMKMILCRLLFFSSFCVHHLPSVSFPPKAAALLSWHCFVQQLALLHSISLIIPTLFKAVHSSWPEDEGDILSGFFGESTNPAPQANWPLLRQSQPNLLLFFMHEHKLLLSTLKWLILGQIFYNRNCSVCVFCLCDRWLVISLRTMEFFVYGHVRAVQGNTAWSYLQQMIFCF